jgi:hypothetical protein
MAGILISDKLRQPGLAERDQVGGGRDIGPLAGRQMDAERQALRLGQGAQLS